MGSPIPQQPTLMVVAEPRVSAGVKLPRAPVSNSQPERGVGRFPPRSQGRSRRAEMVGRGEFMGVHAAWVRGKSITEIARLTGRDRKTIRRLLSEGGPKPRANREVTSKLDPYRRYLLGRILGEDPVTNAEILFDEIKEMGYTGGWTILREFLHPFRELVRERATVRLRSPACGSRPRSTGRLQEAGPQPGEGIRDDPGLVADDVPGFRRDPGAGQPPALPRASLPVLRRTWQRRMRGRDVGQRHARGLPQARGSCGKGQRRK